MERLQKFRDQFATLHVDGLLITSEKNRRYMTGFTGSAGVVLISADRAAFITDFRYMEQADKQVKGFEIVQHKGTIQDEVAKVAKDMGIEKLGFEQEHLTFAQFRTYEENISSDLVPISGAVEKLRLIKSEDEVAIIQDAVNIADAAFEHILTFIRPGLTELEVSNELEFFMRKQGATSSSFDIIVASGHRSALPHGVASDKKIESGELVTLDFGALYKGYVSDITRTIAVGEVEPKLKEIYDVVLQAQLRGVNHTKAGMTGIEADALTRDYIKEKGYGQYFGHSTGHGIGLDVHEAPSLSFKSNTVLEPGMVVTVEPGIYISGLGGVRIEDDIVITDSGNKILSKSSKELITL
ncbi:M24 family metallopeptidase [Bacillus solimangrovi]|uniref:Xaa-Pro dipeptidase n=1 Tax=Bacillus solimangrovi TaxID=1305675 RepID=A0A1E5LKC7_9BACI|nr:Xaa-Pro peptidase family protein [Bacillus solimangrovi]OEH94478.1 Xaa-Pro dipeptidase [Bacillus solimangrovi]